MDFVNAILSAGIHFTTTRLVIIGISSVVSAITSYVLISKLKEEE